MRWRAVIVDDEPGTRDVVKALGHWDELDIGVIGQAADGAAGLELVKQLKPDILLSDVKMPRLTGIELAQTLREMGSPVQIIFISGYDDYGLVRSALKSGACDYLLKPIKERELNEQLSACVQHLRQQEDRLNYPWNIKLENGPWLSQLQQYLKKASDLLHGGDERLIKESFEDLGRSMDGKAELPETIYAYYAFLALVQKYLTEHTCTPEEVYGARELDYVFVVGDDFAAMLNSVCTWYILAVQYVGLRNRQRRRLDLQELCRYVDENFDQNISLQSTADRFFISREYLSRSFKAALGMGFSEYLLSKRMERAKQLLVECRVPIKDIWPMLHFSDQTHFYKCFKSYFGQTPGEMRARLQTDNK